MRCEWREASLGDLIDIKHGFAFKGHFIHDDPSGDVLLTPGNFSIGGGFKGDKLKYYHGPVPEEFVLREGDLLVTMTDLSKQSDTLGFPAFIPPCENGMRYLHNQRLGKVLIREPIETNARYISYVMCGAQYRHEVLASATGTTVKHTSPDRIKQFRFLCAPPSEQRSIANILGTLDDKIALNRRMSETLETMTRALFKDWFVDFGPVRAKAESRDHGLPRSLADLFSARLVDSDLGKIPEGWKPSALPEVIEINPARSLRKGEVAPYLDMANMPTRGHTPGRVVDRPFGSGMRFVNGDTLVARITPCLENGKVAFVDFLKDGQMGWGSTEYIVLRPKQPLPAEFAYCLAGSVEFREFAVQSMTGSSGRQRVPAQALGHFRLAVCPEPISDAFGRAVRPMFARAGEAAAETRTLAILRDSLLPKLISGELRTKDGERLMERAV